MSDFFETIQYLASSFGQIGSFAYFVAYTLIAILTIGGSIPILWTAVLPFYISYLRLAIISKKLYRKN